MFWVGEGLNGTVFVLAGDVFDKVKHILQGLALGEYFLQMHDFLGLAHHSNKYYGEAEK